MDHNHDHSRQLMFHIFYLMKSATNLLQDHYFIGYFGIRERIIYILGCLFYFSFPLLFYFFIY